MADKKRIYLIVCMKRSNYPTTKVYWRPGRAGYTDDVMEAGWYSSNDLDDCAGSRGDWIIEPLWVKR